MTNDVDPRVLTSIDETRRDIVRRLVLGSAFVLPAIASFPMDSPGAGTGARADPQYGNGRR